MCGLPRVSRGIVNRFADGYWSCLYAIFRSTDQDRTYLLVSVCKMLLASI